MSSISYRFRRRLANLGLTPHSRLARFALLCLALDLLLYVVQRVQTSLGHASAAEALNFWIALLSFANAARLLR